MKREAKMVSQMLGIPVPCPRWQEFCLDGDVLPCRWISTYKKKFRLYINVNLIAEMFDLPNVFEWKITNRKEILGEGSERTIEKAKASVRDCLAGHL